MISPRGTWVALGAGTAAIAGAVAPVFAAVASVPNPLTVLFGSAGPKISAACAVIAAICLAIAAIGRSIDPKTDAGPKP